MASYLGKITADFQTQLATAIEIGGTSATLQSATDDDGVALPAGRYFFTIDGDNSSKEHISCSLSGTALTSIKTVSRQGTETSGVLRKHRVGATVTITDFKHIKAINDLLDGTTSFDSATPLGYDGTATISTANQFATKAYVDGVAIAGGADASTTVKGITKMSVAPASASNPIAVGDNDPRVPTTGENDALAGTSGTPSSSNKYVTNDDTTGTGSVVRASVTTNIQKFGGDGSDGALTISSGTTDIDLGGASVVTKNYTSISITGTGALTFSNPASTGTLVRFLSQGDVTITTSATRAIDLRGIGSASATAPDFIFDATNHKGGNGGNGGAGSAGTAGTAGAVWDANTIQWWFTNTAEKLIRQGYGRYMIPGSGGAIGGNGASAGGAGGTGGAGGRGGGALYMEVKGALNITGTIDISGSVGNVGGNASGTACGGGGGGGGGVGHLLCLYNTLTADSSTITALGGAGGNGGTASGTGNAGGGGGGGSAGELVAGVAGGAGGLKNGANGTAGGVGTGGGGGGGGGAGIDGAGAGTVGTGGAAGTQQASAYLITKNYWFA